MGSVFSSILTIVALFVEPITFGIGLCATVIGLLVFAKDIWSIASSSENYYSQQLVSFSVLNKLAKSERYKNFRYDNFHGKLFLYDPDVNDILCNTPLTIAFESKNQFKLSRVAKEIAPFVLTKKKAHGRVLFNEPKIRLSTDLVAEELKRQPLIKLQPTDYYSSVCTNELTGEEIKSKSTKSQIYDGLNFMSDAGLILDLDESLCSNHIGISTVAFTADNRLIITVQTSGAFVDYDKIVSSGSGSATDSDAKSAKTLQEFVVRAMNRELLEECGLPETTGVRTQVTGFARFVNRGAKPEFFGVSFINQPSQALIITGKEALYIADQDTLRVSRHSLDKFLLSLRYLREKSEAKFSLDMHLSLLFLENYIQKFPKSFVTLAGMLF